MIVGQDAGDVPVSRGQGLKDVYTGVGLEESHTRTVTFLPQILSSAEYHNVRTRLQYLPSRWTWKCEKTSLSHPEGWLWSGRTCGRLGKIAVLRSVERREQSRV